MRDLFQSEEFARFLGETGFLEPFRYVVERKGRVVASIQGFIQKDGGRLKRFFSRRAIVNGGPFLAEDVTDQELECLLENSKKSLRGKAIYLETRNYRDFARFRPVFERCGFVYDPHYDFQVRTDSLETAEQNLGKSRKRDIKYSLNNGALVIDNPTPRQIAAFYSLLEALYREKVRTPLFPLDFFLKLSRTAFSKFLLVGLGEEIIGGTVCVHDDETVYEWFACGKDGVYKNVFPSTLATWSGIRFAAENGFVRFDMMGAGAPGDGGYGVREFKAKFGGELVEYGRFKYILNKPLYALGKKGVQWMKKR